MNETEPKYFTEFRQHIDKRLDEVNQNIDDSIGELAISVQNQFIETETSLKEYMKDNFATKVDLGNLATKADLSNFATKLDLYETETRLVGRLDKIDEKLEKIEGHIGI